CQAGISARTPQSTINFMVISTRLVIDFCCSFRDCLSTEPDVRYRSPRHGPPFATDHSQREREFPVVRESTVANPATSLHHPKGPGPCPKGRPQVPDRTARSHISHSSKSFPADHAALRELLHWSPWL